MGKITVPVSTDPPPPRPGDDVRSRARPELLWFLRHADVLARWPVIDEPWARRFATHSPVHGAPTGKGPPDGP